MKIRICNLLILVNRCYSSAVKNTIYIEKTLLVPSLHCTAQNFVLDMEEIDKVGWADLIYSRASEVPVRFKTVTLRSKIVLAISVTTGLILLQWGSLATTHPHINPKCGKAILGQ